MNVGSIVQQIKLAGQTFNKTTNLTAEGSVNKDVSIAGAKSGSLTTRTDDDTGEVTLGAGHGVATGNKVAVYWSGGYRRNVTVGTVAGNVVPIDLGAGDNLPVVTTPVVVMVEQVKEIRFDGDDLVALTANAPSGVRQTIVLTGDDDAEDLVIHLNAANEYKYGWPGIAGEANPVAGDVITKVRMTHDSTSTQTVKVAAAIN